MSSLGRLFNLPRKRSNSTPTKQMLSDYLNKSAAVPDMQPQNQQYSYHHVSSSANAGFSSLPLTTSNKSTDSTHALSVTHSVPLLLASSFYDLTYPFEPCDSPEDEALREVTGTDVQAYSSLSTPSSTTVEIKPQQTSGLNSSNKNKQQQMTQSIHPLPLPNNVYCMQSENDYNEKDDALVDYPRKSQPLTWCSKTSPKKIPMSRSINRRPTPFADQRLGGHSYEEEDSSEFDYGNYYQEPIHCGGGKKHLSAMDDHLVSHNDGKTFNEDNYEAEVQKLQTVIKRLEKKHKEHKRHMLNTKQQLEYLITSRSYESTFLGSSTPHHYSYRQHWGPYLLPPNPTDTHVYHPQSLNEQQHSYLYTHYDRDYYYMNHTPSKPYANQVSSFHYSSSLAGRSKELCNYFAKPEKSNKSAKSTNSSAPAYGYDTFGSMVNDDIYYYQIPQRQNQLVYHNQHLKQQELNNSLNKKENSKRWTQ